MEFNCTRHSYIDYVELIGDEPQTEPEKEYTTTDKEYAYSDKQYLTSPYCLTTNGAADQTNGSLGGTPQIRVGSSAKMLIESDMLKNAEAVLISYAQYGGELEVKLSAGDLPIADGEEIAKFKIKAENDFTTRVSDAILLDKSLVDGKKYLLVEINCTSTSYIDYVEFLTDKKFLAVYFHLVTQHFFILDKGAIWQIQGR